MSSDPITIYQGWLDTVSDILMDGQLDLLPKYVSLPYLHQAHDNRTMLETEQDLTDGFRVFLASMRAQGANQFIRLASAAQYLSDDYISGVHVTHVLRNATPVVPSFVSRMVLRRGPTHWKLVENVGDYAHGKWPIRIMRVTSKSIGDGSKDEDDARRDSAQPLVLYQRLINALTQANVAEDIDAFCELCDFPYTSHTENEDVTVSSKEELRPFFETVTRLLRENRVDGFIREADHAEFVSGDTICGYHTARFLREEAEVLEPIKSRILLRRTGTKWRMLSVTNGVTGSVFAMGGLPETGDLISVRKIQERTRP